MQTNLQLIIPEFVMLGTAFLLLVLDLFMKKGPRRSFGVIGIIGSVIAGVSLLYQGGGTALSDLFIQDRVSIFFKWLFLGLNVFILYAAILYEDRIRHWKGEFYALVIFAMAGMMFLSSSADFIGFYISLEFVSVCLFILAAFTSEKRISSEAGIKYLVTGALASGFLLYGISFIYGSSGMTAFTDVARLLKTGPGNGFLIIGLTLVVIGMTFKVAAIPFHVWAPDVYQGAPTPVTAMLATASKSAGFIVLMRILFTALASVKGQWVMLVAIISGASLIFGNLSAMPQKDIKRLIAYGGIGSAGYLLIAIASASALGAGAIMFYLITYSLGVLGSFIAIVVFSNSERSDLIESYAGLGRRSPLLAATLFIGLLSIAGVPPLGGFIAKFYIIASAVKEGLWALAVIGVVMAVVAMYYFLLIVKSMYLRPPVNTDPIRVDVTTRAVLYLINAATLFLGIYPGPLTDWVMSIAKTMF